MTIDPQPAHTSKVTIIEYLPYRLLPCGIIVQTDFRISLRGGEVDWIEISCYFLSRAQLPRSREVFQLIRSKLLGEIEIIREPALRKPKIKRQCNSEIQLWVPDKDLRPVPWWHREDHLLYHFAAAGIGFYKDPIYRCGDVFDAIEAVMVELHDSGIGGSPARLRCQMGGGRSEPYVEGGEDDGQGCEGYTLWGLLTYVAL
jgi:hypothetical protein